MDDLHFSPLSDTSIIIDFGGSISVEKNQQILNFVDVICSDPFPGFLEAVPSYTTVTIFYDPLVIQHAFPYEYVCQWAEEKLTKLVEQKRPASKLVQIPVCYDQALGPDLETVAAYHQRTTEEVIHLHTSQRYHVYFLGFSPGFPFLGGLDPAIATPRKSTPRLKIPAGSVGIAGQQTGVYPLETPGGWQIIGRTPLRLFSLEQEHPTLLQPGDQVEFIPITREEFEGWDQS
ncbi:5-oxoprolinase subunit PxpB [Rubeoparvulum massiliense]|uniref:5-oxoprolinase subunit PxpB n=1 Tax=Rubeoparvulum massiliense TaxID=1631346 RepID=UPI00065E05F7|nr:5-oxoprolinase subunit PxpB [Rubeoparvulum massiliense]